MCKSKLMVVSLFVVSIMFFATPLSAEDGYKVSYTVEFSQDDLSFDKLMGYDMVRLKEGDFFAELAKPMLPSKELRIALPAGMAVKTVNVVDAKSEEIPGEYNIFPSQPPIRIGSSDGDADFVEPDNQTYTSSQPYPSKLMEFVHQTDLAGQGIAMLRLYPLQYVPSERKLTLYTFITIEIVGVGGYECGDYLSPNISEKGRRTYEQMVKDMVENPEDVQLNMGLKGGSLSDLPDGPFDHVIITSSSYSSYFWPLVNWHTQKGVKDTVILTGWIYENYSGTTNQQKIRNFIQDANWTWGTIYFLLGGEHETVPFEYRTYYAGESTPSDQYYSDYDDDWTHEVFVGRVTVGDTIQINTFVDKVLKYEKDPLRTDYPLDALLMADDLDFVTHCEDLKDTIDSYIPPRFNVKKIYCGHGGNLKDSIIYYLNAGQNLVNHAGHAGETFFCVCTPPSECIYNPDVDCLTNNDQMSILVFPGCHANHMDYEDCIGEHFVIYNPYRAGIAFTGNTRDGWVYSGNPFSLACELDLEWWKGLFDRNKYNLGQTLVDSKHHFSTSGGDADLKKHCEWTFNLLGEPEMPIWTDDPDSFAVTHPDTIPRGTSSCLVHVEDSTTHVPVESAYVCLLKDGEGYLRGYTDASGDITVSPSPSTEGTMYLTVTKHNYLPYQQEVEITYRRGDANWDGVIDISDVVYLINYLFVGGPEPVPCLQAGDANCDGSVTVSDVVYLINYLFAGGPPPSC